MSKVRDDEWWAIRLPKKNEGGPKKEIGPNTHGMARAVASEWYFEGYRVELRRRRPDEKDHIVIPKFPLIDRKRSKAS